MDNCLFVTCQIFSLNVYQSFVIELIGFEQFGFFYGLKWN